MVRDRSEFQELNLARRRQCLTHPAPGEVALIRPVTGFEQGRAKQSDFDDFASNAAVLAAPITRFSR